MKKQLVAVALVIFAPAWAAGPPIDMTIPCSQNLSNGKIIVDGNLLPVGARYIVRHYMPKSSDKASGWSNGECRITVTKGISG